MPLSNSTIPAAVETNQFQPFWKTRSPVPCSERIAFRRDLVVLVCQPPSWSFTKVSPISAIRLPWRNTKLTPSLLTTIVLSCFQSTSRVMAAFMRRSILRIGVNCVDLLSMAGSRGNCKTPCASLESVTRRSRGDLSSCYTTKTYQICYQTALQFAGRNHNTLPCCCWDTSAGRGCEWCQCWSSCSLEFLSNRSRITDIRAEVKGLVHKSCLSVL